MHTADMHSATNVRRTAWPGQWSTQSHSNVVLLIAGPRSVTFCLYLLMLMSLYSPAGYSASEFQYQISGLAEPLLANVHAHFKQSLAEKQPNTKKQIKDWYHHSPLIIKEALAPFAYFDPTVQAQLIRRGKQWSAHYQITPGPLLRITRLEFQLIGTGANDLKLKQLLATLPALQPGQAVSTPAYEQAKQSLYQAVLAQGYLDAQWRQHRIAIDRKRHTAVITLQIDTGPIYYFGPIILQQLPPNAHKARTAAVLLDHNMADLSRGRPGTFTEAFLRRYIPPLRSGDQYSAEQLFALQDRWSNSGYFQQVSIKEQPAREDRHIPLIVSLQPHRPYWYTFSVGYGTDVGPRASTEWQARYLTATGHRANFSGQFSKRQPNLQATYSIPGLQPVTTRYDISLAWFRKNLPQVKWTKQQLSLAAIHHSNSWQRTVFLNYQIEYAEDSNHSHRYTHLLIPGINWQWVRTSQQPYPNNGYRVTAFLQGGIPGLQFNPGFLQAELQGKYIKSFSEHNYLILRGDIGYTWITDSQRLPYSLSFYAGGSQSVRGYDYQQLGPGRYLLVTSIEYQQRLMGNFYLASFLDAGNATNQWPLILQKGAGVGLVWFSPVGPMELTLGQALSLPHRPWKIQFSIGTTLL